MAKFAKVIDVEGVKGIDQILIYVHQNDDDRYVCSIFTHLPTCEANLVLNMAPKNEEDNCFDSAFGVFTQISNTPDETIIKAITNSPIYKVFLEEAGELNDD